MERMKEGGGKSSPRIRYNMSAFSSSKSAHDDEHVRVHAPTYFTRVFSTGPADGFCCPMGISLGLFGALYVCDGGNNRMVRLDKEGNVVTLLTDATGVLSFPEAMVFDRMGGARTGTMYVMDCTNTLYQVSALTRTFTPYATINGHYLGMTIDSRDNIYYSSLDYLNDTVKMPTPAVYRVAKDATGNRVASMFIDLTDVMVYPCGIVATNEYLFVADAGGNTIAKCDLETGKIINPAFITLTPANNPTFDPMLSVAENIATATFNSYCGNQCNFDIDPTTGDFIVLSGNNDGAATMVSRYDKHGEFICNMATTADGLNSPVAVAVDRSGRVFVSNQNGNNVSIITKA